MKKIFCLLIITFTSFGAFAQFTDDNINNTLVWKGPNQQTSIKASTHPDGSTYFTYISFENTPIPPATGAMQVLYLQCLSKNGVLKWPGKGLVISDKPTGSASDDYSMAGTDDDGTLAIFKDFRKFRPRPGAMGYYFSDVYVYKYAADGSPTWGAEGKKLNTSRGGIECSAPRLALYPGNVALANWTDYNEAKNTGAILVKKVSATDGKILAADSIFSSSVDTNYVINNFKTNRFSNGNYLATYMFKSGGTGFNLPSQFHAMGYDANLKRLWKTPIFTGKGISIGGDYMTVADDKGGVYILFGYLSPVLQKPSIRVQHIRSDGKLSYKKDLSISTDTLHRQFGTPVAYYNKEKSCLSVYYASVDLAYKNEMIEFQEFNDRGYLRADTGKVLINAPANASILPTKAIPQPGGQTILFYQDNQTNTKIKAIRYTNEKKPIYEKLISNYHPDLGKTSLKGSINVGDPVNNQVVAVWSDTRVGAIYSGDIYAQNMLLDGRLGNQGVLDVSPTKLTMTVGDTITLKSLVQPLNLGLHAVYKSDYPGLVSVDQYGNVKAQAYGNAVITVTAFEGAQSIQIPVQVLDTPHDKNSLQVFTAFSPNNDGANDVFYIQNIEKFGGNHLTVFDASGRKHYEATDYNNTWDATASTGPYKGSKIPQGTYYYVLELSNGNSRKGFVVIKY
ncbi:T9SS type B sorting domain-containing protein [Pedobacter sp. HMF7647]|uniref:T9SS type B sorting domain-containing protein n=2 Tax=Hufsiella arboris TaxID=2695275 RepID=A0A7K1YCN9_9SPHI|nr:T9SS type B sorting domain-containing protein [Hufsiella arboris]